MILGIDVRIAAPGERVQRDAQLVIEPAQIRLAEYYADRAGIGPGISQDRVSGHRHVVSTRRGGVRHRDDQRLLLAEQVHLPPDIVGRHGVAAGRIDAHDHAPDASVVSNPAQQFIEPFRADAALAVSIVTGAAARDVSLAD